jgi:hypothetical protein
MERASDIDWAARPVSHIPCCRRENAKGKDTRRIQALHIDEGISEKAIERVREERRKVPA